MRRGYWSFLPLSSLSTFLPPCLLTVPSFHTPSFLTTLLLPFCLIPSFYPSFFTTPLSLPSSLSLSLHNCPPYFPPPLSLRLSPCLSSPSTSFHPSVTTTFLVLSHTLTLSPQLSVLGHSLITAFLFPFLSFSIFHSSKCPRSHPIPGVLFLTIFITFSRPFFTRHLVHLLTLPPPARPSPPSSNLHVHYKESSVS